MSLNFDPLRKHNAQRPYLLTLMSLGCLGQFAETLSKSEQIGLNQDQPSNRQGNTLRLSMQLVPLHTTRLGQWRGPKAPVLRDGRSILRSIFLESDNSNLTTVGTRYIWSQTLGSLTKKSQLLHSNLTYCTT